MPKKFYFIGAFIIYIGSVFIRNIEPEPEPKPTHVNIEVKPKTEKQKSDEIIAKAQEEFELRKVAIPFTQDKYPKLYRQWGDKWMYRANKAMYPAVLKANKHYLCDKPNMIGISEKSTIKKELIFFVNCNNYEQVFVSENVALRGGTTIAKSEILNEEKPETR